MIRARLTGTRMSRWRHERSKARQKLQRRHEPHSVAVFDTVADPTVFEHR